VVLGLGLLIPWWLFRSTSLWLSGRESEWTGVEIVKEGRCYLVRQVGDGDNSHFHIYPQPGLWMRRVSEVNRFGVILNIGYEWMGVGHFEFESR
jgi:hypothetical protein